MTARSAEALRRVFDALAEHGCEPELTADGRGIVATCPCCHEERGLVVQLGEPEGGEQ
jgi:hypothetical protein